MVGGLSAQNSKGGLSAQNSRSSLGLGSEYEAPVTARRTSDAAPQLVAEPSICQRDVNRETILSFLEKPPGKTPIPRSKVEKTLPKLTHLHLNAQRITRIATSAANAVPQLEVLYLYDNLIESVENICALTCLTHLYLQNNQIFDLSPLGYMPNLQKLYLQGNQLAYVSGLDNCPRLEELHLCNQRLPAGAGSGLALDPACMAALCPRLRVLCATNCGITRELPNLEGLAELRRLTKLDLSKNALADAVALEEVLRPLSQLAWLDVRENPLARHNKHRDGLMIALDNLVTLDDEAVKPAQREFLLRLHLKRLKAGYAADAAAERAAEEGSSGGGGGGPGWGGGRGGVGAVDVPDGGVDRGLMVTAASKVAGHKPLPQRAGGFGITRSPSMKKS